MRVKNQDRESEKNYYESVILARAARIKDSQSEEERKDELIHQQKEDLAELQGKYATSQKKYEQLFKEFPDKLQKLQERIDTQRKQLDDLEKSALDVETTIGLKGNTLIQCLVAVRAFTKSHKDSAQMYAPLASILKGEFAYLSCECE